MSETRLPNLGGDGVAVTTGVSNRGRVVGFVAATNSPYEYQGKPFIYYRRAHRMDDMSDVLADPSYGLGIQAGRVWGVAGWFREQSIVDLRDEPLTAGPLALREVAGVWGDWAAGTYFDDSDHAVAIPRLVDLTTGSVIRVWDLPGAPFAAGQVRGIARGLAVGVLALSDPFNDTRAYIVDLHGEAPVFQWFDPGPGAGNFDVGSVVTDGRYVAVAGYDGTQPILVRDLASSESTPISISFDHPGPIYIAGVRHGVVFGVSYSDDYAQSQPFVIDLRSARPTVLLLGTPVKFASVPLGFYRGMLLALTEPTDTATLVAFGVRTCPGAVVELGRTASLPRYGTPVAMAGRYIAVNDKLWRLSVSVHRNYGAG